MPNSNHIAAVDDDNCVRSAVAELLRSRGYILKCQKAAFVVLNIELGNENGLDVLAAIKAASPSVRVVILTGRGYADESWKAARKHGADGYISKTLPPTQLLMEVKRWMKRPMKLDVPSFRER